MDVEKRYRDQAYRKRLSSSIKSFYDSPQGLDVRKMIAQRQCTNTEDRFWSLIDMSGDCWIFQGNTQTANGYGQISVRGLGIRDTLAHRIAWILTKGAIPDGMCVCHSCDTPPCCNPDHLFLGTMEDNMNDMVLKRRDAFSRRNFIPKRGQESPTSKLTADQVLEIRARRKSGEMGSRLAREYGVHMNTVYSICKGKTWK